MRPVSESTSRVVGQNCSKKYIALGRVAAQWAEIIGKDMAAQAQPSKMHYRKSKDGKSPDVTLEIATTPAHATNLHYRKDLILQKINTLFGEGWITAIKFTALSSPPPKSKYKKPVSRPAGPEDKEALQSLLETIEDEDIKIRLEKLGEAVINTGN